MAYTISTHTGAEVARGHNIRDARCTAKDGHIDPEGVHETWLDETVRHAYHRLFDKAAEEYSETQPSSRKITNYYAKIVKDAKKHPVYEMIVAIGNKDHPVDPETGKKIMRQFVRDWQKRNPNMILIGAYYHADEDGVPHVHLDYIPVAYGYKRGMSIQTSYSKALDEMGFSGRRGGAAWWASENQALESICNEHGIEVEHPERGKGMEHMHTLKYQADRDLDHAREQARQLRADASREYNAVTLRADTDAGRTLRTAKARAGEIITDANEKAAQIVSDARTKAHEIEMDATLTRREAEALRMDAKREYATAEEYRRITEFDPDAWEGLRNRAARAKEIEDLYYDAVNTGTWGKSDMYRHWLSDGSMLSDLQLLQEYKRECEEHGLYHNEDMYDALSDMEAEHRRQVEYDIER